MSFEDDLGWEYFGPADPMSSPRMMSHMDWHTAPENQARTGNYGERFLLFHKDFIDSFDAWRLTKGLMPVTAWDPATPIPAYLSHDHTLMAARNTSDPAAADPACITPTWATMAGGTTPDPLHGYTMLSQFQSLDELGRSIDSGWHGRVHNTIGGDMSTFHSPIDPVFWRWHKWIDNVRGAWETARMIAHIRLTASAVKTLFGITNDGPGVYIGPDGKVHPWPGPDPEPWWRSLSPGTQDVLVGLAVSEMANVINDRGARNEIQKVGQRLAGVKAIRSAPVGTVDRAVARMLADQTAPAMSESR